jgi:triacylglycerol lipase
MGFGDISVGPIKIPYFRGIDRALRERGHGLIISRVHPTGSIERRARELKANIERGLEQTDGNEDRVIVIAHSMGGLDARYMIAKLGMHDRVAALLTITSPHRGSPYADWCLENLGRRLGGLKLIKCLGLDMEAIADLTTESCRKFNRRIKNVPGVLYFSVSAARPWHRVPPWAMHSHKVIAGAEGENDGLVSVKSSTWGEHLGVWPTDHWHAVNHKMIVEIKQPTGSVLPYYMKAIDRVIECL